MSENILYRFAKDLSQLYAKTRLKLVEDLFVKIAQAHEEELEKWLLKANQTNIKMSLNNPEVFDAIFTLAKIRKAHPAGISVPEFSTLILNDPSILRHAPMFIALKQIANGNDFAVLNPFKNILSAGLEGFSDTSGVPIDMGSTLETINLLDTMFREYLDQLIEKTYDDSNPSSKKKKLTKKEKVINLLSYLVRRFSDEISFAYDQTGKIDSVGLADSLNDPKKILQIMYPNMPKHTLELLVEKARKVVNEAIKYTDPDHYDMAYNLVKAEVMLHSAYISRQEYNNYLYEHNMTLQRLNVPEYEESNKINTPPEAWNFPQSIVFLSIVLYFIGSKIK